MTRALRRAQRIADRGDDVLRDGEVLRVPLTLMDADMISGLRERFPPIRTSDVIDDGHGGFTIDRRAGEERRQARDARKATEAAIATRAVMQQDAIIANSYRPGWRTAADYLDAEGKPRRARTSVTLESPTGHSVSYTHTEGDDQAPGTSQIDGMMSDSERARAAYIAELCDSWRPKDAYSGTPAIGNTTREIPTLPAGRYPFSAGEGGACSIDGRAGTLVREGEYLVCRAKPSIGPSRSSETVNRSDAMTSDRSLQDRAWEEMVRAQNEMWRTPP
jgi:hypothetical protein